MTQRFFQRAFSSSPLGRIRDHYNRSSGPPPPRGGALDTIRARVNRWNPLHVVYVIMALNAIVFLLWQYAISSWQRFRDPALYNWMWKNFILCMPNITEGRIWTLVTSTFSQMSTAHIFFNMLGLYFMAPAVAGLLGAFNFLGLYIGGGLVAGLCSLAYQTFNTNKTRRIGGSEGASGAIYACLAFYGTIFPQATFLLFFIIPARAWMVVGGLFAWDFWQAVTSRQGLTDSAGHAGGIAFGVASALYARHKYLGSWRRGFRM
jgi:membrane associated rhomboid family serine protease